MPINGSVPHQRPSCAVNAPAILAEHGIPDFAAWVRSAHADRHGKIVGPSNRTRPADRALQLPFLALNECNSIRVLALDCDHPDSFRHAIWARELPQPGIEVWRDGGGLLALWPLARRVHRGSQARQRPVRLFGRTAEFFTKAAGADPHFNPDGPIRNPAAPHDSWKVIRNGRGGFQLVELHEFLPARWSLPRPAALLTDAARNCSVFDALMRFAGRWSNRDADLQAEGEVLNTDMFARSPRGPLPSQEVGWIAASVGRYRAQWIDQGRYQADPERQAERGRRSGAARRRRTALRDAQIRQWASEGWTQARIAAEVGLSQQRVAQITSEPTQVGTWNLSDRDSTFFGGGSLFFSG
ncbi:MAG: replication initiation protein [Gammaproteobacteria bacterium]|nr:replication initiation protein [Gammaproteobacteria bacterium]MDE2882603.1 replication initiation protein [Acidobacteriota bacterium]